MNSTISAEDWKHEFTPIKFRVASCGFADRYCSWNSRSNQKTRSWKIVTRRRNENRAPSKIEDCKVLMTGKIEGWEAWCLERFVSRSPGVVFLAGAGVAEWQTLRT